MTVLNQLVIGASIGAVLLLIALGLTFTFGQMGVINLAHGEFIMAGAYTAFVLQGMFGTFAVPAALPVAFVVAGGLGLVLERLAIRRFYGRPLDTLLLTFGVSLILQQAARSIFGAPNVNVTRPTWLEGNLAIGAVRLPYTRMFMLALALGCVAAVFVYLIRTRHGRRMRAVVQNRQLASVTGVNTSRVDQLTFFIGSGLAGVAGVAITLIGPIGPNLGTVYIVDAFLVVIAGGLGQLRGAVLVAFALGMFNSFVESVTDASLAKVVVFVMIVAFLQFRPQGLVALRTRALT
jgi:urea transport system permease protein